MTKSTKKITCTPLGPKTTLAIELGAKPGGISPTELGKALDVNSSVANGYLMTATGRGKLFRGLSSHSSRCYRYFGTEAEAIKFGLSAPPSSIGGIHQGRVSSASPAFKAAKADYSRAKRIQCPHGVDHRFTAVLPDGYVSQINAAECRPWAASL